MCMYNCLWVSATTRVRILCILAFFNPLQLVIHMVQNHHAWVQGTNWDETKMMTFPPLSILRLTKACSPVGLISLKWIEYRIQYHKGQGSIPGQTWIFSSSFSTAYVTQLQESFPLSILVTLYNNSEHFLSQILGCQGKTNWILPWGFF